MVSHRTEHRRQERRRKESLENISETTGESKTWERRKAQPQIGSFTERMHKHTVEVLVKSGHPMNGLFVSH